MSKRIVPWYNQQEWKQVYENLYSNDPLKQLIAINKTKAWSSRGRVPHSIESTALMVEISLNNNLSEQEQRYIYSMAIIRFVNGIVDSGQKGLYASSAVGVAEQLGLPIWFVEQRHQATHDRIPLLPYLQQSRLAALEWLRVNYWNVQDTAHDDLKAVIAVKIKEYKQVSNEKNVKQQRKLVEDITTLLSPDDFKEILVTGFIEEILAVVGTSPSPDIISLHEISIYNELKTWKVFIETCITVFPNITMVLFETLLSLNPTPSTTEWLKHILNTTNFNPQDTLGLLKICFENSNHRDVKQFLEIIRRFKSMPGQDHRYHVLIDYVLRNNRCHSDHTLNLKSKQSAMIDGDGIDTIVTDEGVVEIAERQIEIVKKKLSEDVRETLPQSNQKWILADGINCQVGEILEGEDLDLDLCYDDMTWLNDNNMLFIPVPKADEDTVEGNDDGNGNEMQVDQSRLIIY